MFSFKNQVILITGASRGVGAATAIKFAQAGAAAVVINYQNNILAAKTTADLVEKAGAQALLIKTDVTIASEVQALFNKTLHQFGRLDVVVSNAGIWPVQEQAITELDENQWLRTMNVNLNGVFLVCREAAQIFSSQKSGNLVIISSTAGQRGEAFHSDYAASKGALISLTKSLAVELGRYNVRVNCVAPGWIDTDMAASALRSNEEDLAKITSTIPLGRVAAADDVANPVLFLASELARHITGEILNVNGGSVLCG